MQQKIPEFSKTDYLSTTAPYEFLEKYKDRKFELKQILGVMSEQAKAVGVRNLSALFKAYMESASGKFIDVADRKTDFTGQEFELSCGSWTATDMGVSGVDKFGFDVTACSHPIMPVQRLVNIDTGIHKVKIAFSLGRRWNTVIEDRSTISDSRSIIGLSKYGVMVNSETAKPLVKYMADMEQLNYDTIPEVSSVGRLGWIDDYGFSPYVDGLVFDGDEQFRSRFESIRERGSYEKWMECAKAARAGATPGNIIARIVLAASFASVLVKPCNCLPFFVHLWGGTETGKAQPLDTKVITPSGYKLMGNIRVGDLVIGSDGKPHAVTGVYPQGIKKVYRIMFSDGTSTRCCKEHLWTVSTRTRREHGRGYTVMSLEEMLKKPIKGRKGYTYRIPCTEPVEYEAGVELPVNPYLLGALIGDGCLTLTKNPANGNINIYFSNTESDVVGKVNSLLIDIGCSLKRNKATQCQYTVVGDGKHLLADKIRSLGLNVKSTERFIPKEYMFTTVLSRKQLLAGLFDTDGCVHKAGGFSYSTKSEQLAYNVADLSRSLGYRATVRDGRDGEYSVRIFTDTAIYSSEKHEARYSKHAAKRNRSEDRKSLAIVDVQPEGEELCQCIMVDSAEHTYLCDDFIVTHNTVSLLLAASVWANPEIGTYIQTFNSTAVGKEMGAAFCNSMPLIIDELQLIKDKRKDFDQMIYELSEGVGKARGNKNGGLQKTTTWRNCILTTGEFPIISANSGAGAINRTIEVNCQGQHLFDDPKQTSATLYGNYGFAGKLFIYKLMEPGNMERARTLQNKWQDAIKSKDTMDKQTASAALILAADELAEEWIFRDGVRLSPSDITPYLVSKDMVNQNGRALQFLYDFVNINQVKFSQGTADYNGEIWGDMDGQYIYIIKSKFDQILNDEGYNSSAFIGWAKGKNLLSLSSDGKTTKPKRIKGNVCRCVWLRAPENWEFEEENGSELPF